ncbi:putative type II/III system pilus formation protein [Rhizobium sp. PP-WC-1G-195]|nr:putative type II/III system pilus formation protein [Rhizobium sp. PP-WC-1G-195]
MAFPSLSRVSSFALTHIRTMIGAALCLAAGAMMPGFAIAQDAALMNVYLNHARVLKLDRSVSRVIIGSAEIADATVADAQTIVLTGKAVGTTNIVILDENDNPIVDQRILVSTDEGNTLRVYRSTARAVLTCTPSCEEHTKK